MRICHSKELARCTVSSRTQALVRSSKMLLLLQFFYKEESQYVGVNPSRLQVGDVSRTQMLQGPHHVQLLVNSSREFWS